MYAMCALIAAIMMTTSSNDLGVMLPLVIFVSSHALLPVRDFVICFFFRLLTPFHYCKDYSPSLVVALLCKYGSQTPVMWNYLQLQPVIIQFLCSCFSRVCYVWCLRLCLSPFLELFEIQALCRTPLSSPNQITNGNALQVNAPPSL